MPSATNSPYKNVCTLIDNKNVVYGMMASHDHFNFWGACCRFDSQP